MPNINKEASKCKHPNSRKTVALAKKTKKIAHKNEAKMGQLIKQNIVGEKIQWFKDNLPEGDYTVCSKEQVLYLLDKYMSRFEEELAQIELKHSIGGRKNRQHASREDVIAMTVKRDKEEQESCGLEIPDLMNASQLSLLRSWNGELRFISNFKLKRFPKRLLV